MSQNFSLQELNTALKNNLRQDSTQGNPTLLLVYDVSYAIATRLAIEPVGVPHQHIVCIHWDTVRQ